MLDKFIIIYGINKFICSIEELDKLFKILEIFLSLLIIKLDIFGSIS